MLIPKAKPVTTRFAPSPTGRLHVGNIRTAIHNWLWAKKCGGRFLLRIDDTDPARSKEEYVEGICEDLRWLGIDWDAQERQSERLLHYEDIFEQLKTTGRVYACYETPEDLAVRRKLLLSRGLPPIYERKPLGAAAPSNSAAHWRFRLDHDKPVEWHDLIRGAQYFDPALLSDPVIRRADGSWLYLLPSVIDDAAMEVTHVVRGEDHVANTAVQVQMFAAIGAPQPDFAHEALLVGAEVEAAAEGGARVEAMTRTEAAAEGRASQAVARASGKLSKRHGSQGMAYFRDAGFESLALLGLLARIGTSDPTQPVTDTAPLIERIDFARFGRAPARFDEGELVLLNRQIIHRLAYEAVADRLPEAIDARRWEAIRPNLSRLAEAVDWVAIFTGPFEPPVLAGKEREVAAKAAQIAALMGSQWSKDSVTGENAEGYWHRLTRAVKRETGISGRSLFLPLRRALTGRDSGPDMATLLPLIAHEEAVRRLRCAGGLDDEAAGVA